MGNTSATQQTALTESFRVGDWHVHAATNRLSRGDTIVKLEPRTMQVLVCLAESAGEVVTRERLEEEVWRGMVVSYDALNHAITKLRKAVDDDPHHPQIIETIPKVGYRLIAEVSYPSPVSESAVGGERPESPTAGTPAARAQPPGRRRVAGAAALVALVTAAALLVWFEPWEPGEEPMSMGHQALPLPDKPSIAVLPFINLSGDPEQEYFTDGMTDDLITGLSKVSGLFVISRNSTFTYKGKPIKAQQVAQELGVRYVLEGSVRRAGDHVRINAQLIDATTGGHVWAERYDSSLTDIFALQDKVTRQIITALAVNLTADEEAQQERKETDNPEAYEAVLRGRAHFKLYTPEDFAKAIRYLEKAIELDPDYIRPHTWLAAIYFETYNNEWSRSLGMSSEDAKKKTKQHQKEALKDPSSRDNYTVSKVLTKEGRFAEGIATAERMIALNPSDVNGYLAMGRAANKAGRFAEGLAAMKMAMRLDPGGNDRGTYSYRLAEAQFHLERYEQAAANFKTSVERNPADEWIFQYLAAAYGHLGREKEAKAALGAFEEARAKKGKEPYTLAKIDGWTDFKKRADLERYREGLRKAGMPPG